jgi:hypothetical protein
MSSSLSTLVDLQEDTVVRRHRLGHVAAKPTAVKISTSPHVVQAEGRGGAAGKPRHLREREGEILRRVTIVDQQHCHQTVAGVASGKRFVPGLPSGKDTGGRVGVGVVASKSAG